MDPRTNNPRDVLARKVDRSSGPNACHLWTGRHRTRAGYGLFRIAGKRCRAHRVTYELMIGEPIPQGLHVLHSCDNPPCCNPLHLRLGTDADNRADTIKRDRMPSRKNARNALVLAKRRGGSTLRELAAYFGVHKRTIQKALISERRRERLRSQ
jgi:hypothetical protein